MIKKCKTTTRPLTESSWLAQSIRDMMTTEFDAHLDEHLVTPKYFVLEVLKIIVNEADNNDNRSIYYQNTGGKLEIVVCDIPSMTQYGSDFDQEGMRCGLRGLAEKYKNDDGYYTVFVNTTHDLNSATINVSDLMYELRK